MDIQSLCQVDVFLQVRGITPGRAAAIVPAVIGLISVIIGWLALTRSEHRIRLWKLMAILALMVGLTSMVLSGLHLVRATGAIGSGSGRLGAIVAMVIGLIGLVLNGLALARFQRIVTRSHSSTTSTVVPRERT